MTDRVITARVVLNLELTIHDSAIDAEEAVGIVLEAMFVDDAINLNPDDPEDDSHGSLRLHGDPNIAEIEITSEEEAK